MGPISRILSSFVGVDVGVTGLLDLVADNIMEDDMRLIPFIPNQAIDIGHKQSYCNEMHCNVQIGNGMASVRT